jgi:uncharacterized membrane protein
MALSRWIKHLLTTRWKMNQLFPEHSLAAIKTAIGTAEASHCGEIRFAIETALSPGQLWQGMTARERALEVFSLLRVWDTADNNGVLIYVLLADKAVEIIADRGIHQRTGGNQAWQRIIASMRDAFAAGRFEEGAVAGVGAVAEELVKHFPSTGANAGELLDDVVML